jgi:hypothetical protein
MAKVKYIGPKGKITVQMPADAKTKAQVVEYMMFMHGEEKEVRDIFAEKLVKADSNFKLVEEKPSSTLPEKETVVEKKEKPVQAKAPAKKKVVAKKAAPKAAANTYDSAEEKTGS